MIDELDSIRRIRVSRGLWIILAVMVVVWLYGVLQNYRMASNINNHFIKRQSFDIARHAKDTKVACVINPYFHNTQNIAPIRERLTAKEVIKLNRRVHEFFGEERYWHLVLLSDGGHRVYHIRFLGYRLDIKDYHCVKAGTDHLRLTTVYRDGQMYLKME